jgi:hypothetical protein
MFTNSTQGVQAARITILVFATLLVATIAVPLQASVARNVSEESRRNAELKFNATVPSRTPPDETTRVHIWIPGFDDEEPVMTCSPIPMTNLSTKKDSNHAYFRVGFAAKSHSGNLADGAGCSGLVRMLLWTSHSAPPKNPSLSITAYDNAGIPVNRR